MGRLSRRHLLASLGALGGGGIIGLRHSMDATHGPWYKSNPHQLHRPHPGTDPYDVDIALFTTESFHQSAGFPPIQHRMGLIKTALEEAIPTLSDDRLSLTTTVTCIESPVPEDISYDDDIDAFLAAFQEHVNELPDDVRGADANVLITDTDASYQGGLGMYQASVYSNGCTPFGSVVMGGERLTGSELQVRTHWETQSQEILARVVHEVGHNIGLTHEMGDAWTEGSITYVTPMAGGYVTNDEFPSENIYGSTVPEPHEIDRLVITPYFNPDIPTDHLVVGDGNAVGCAVGGAVTNAFE